MKVRSYHKSHPQRSSFPYYDSILTLAQDSDIWLPSLPGGSATDKIIGKRCFEARSPGNLHHVARGSAVDETALSMALDSKPDRSRGVGPFNEARTSTFPKP